jgi:hypothetical protein
MIHYERYLTLHTVLLVAALVFAALAMAGRPPPARYPRFQYGWASILFLILAFVFIG